MSDKKARFEYVCSASAQCGMTLLSATVDPSSSCIRRVIDKTVDLLGDHNITGLYNGYTHEADGKHMFLGKHFATPMHSDSGGLQIVTRGFTADKEMKEKVYSAQAKYCGVAMCFDEIPTTIERNAALRKFDPSLVKEKANLTGLNIVEQAKYFDKVNAACQIFVVAQGNDMETYHQWVDEIVKVVPKDLYHRIGGMSFAATSSGSGEAEDIERVWAFTNCPAPDEWKHKFHLLGVGSPTRMLPALGLMHSGVLKDVLVSYDSSTHTQGVSRRKYLSESCKFIECGNGSMESFPKMVETRQLYDYAKKYFDIEADFDTFTYTFHHTKKNFVAKYGEDQIAIFHEVLMAACMVSVYHITKRLERAMKSEKAFANLCQERGSYFHRHLTSLKTQADYDYLMKELRGAFTSAKLKHVGDEATLEAFF